MDNWKEWASCVEVPAEMFFTEEGESYGRIEITQVIQSVCGNCPVSGECLDYAMEQEAGFPPHLRHGVYGGMTPMERHRLSIGRPAKLNNLCQRREHEMSPENVVVRPSGARECRACRDAYRREWGQRANAG